MHVSTNPVDVCLIDDDAQFRALTTRTLSTSGLRVVEASDGESGFDLIKSEHPKVVLCDYDLPSRSGLDICSKLRADDAVADTYFVLISANVTQELRRRAWDAGADDIIRKTTPAEEIIARIHVGQRMWGLRERLRAAAITDGLTRLYNHDHFNRLLDREFSRARRYGRPLAVILLDIDHFKAINDTFGHLAGNAVLEELGRLLRDNARDVDMVGRFGGEEFIVLLPESSAIEAARVAQRMQYAISEQLNIPILGEHQVTASFGIADSDDPAVKSAADLINQADRALYTAKHRGRDQIVLAADLEETEDAETSTPFDRVEALQKRVAVLKALARDVYGQSISCLSQALVEKDPYTARHSSNVAFYAAELAGQMGCAQGTVQSVYNAALLHDIGKVGIPDRILMKRGPLSPMEQTIIVQVPYISTRIVECLRILESEVTIIRHQREYYDGTGSPAGLKGDQIPIGSRILLVADAFDAMTTDRVYRQRRGIDEAVAELRAGAGRQFDPRVVLALEQALKDSRTAWQARIDESVDLFQLPSLAS